MTMDEMLAIVKPHNDKIVAESRLARCEQSRAELLAALEDILFHFGNPKRDEWLSDAAFHAAKAADTRARALIARINGGPK